MNILAVCELNFARSPTLEYLLKKKAKKAKLNIKIKSAALLTRKKKKSQIGDIFYFLRKYVPPFTAKKLTREKADWADKIIVMEPYMKEKIMEKYQQNKEKITCLDVSEKYWFPYQPKLIKHLEEKLKTYDFL